MIKTGFIYFFTILALVFGSCSKRLKPAADLNYEQKRLFDTYYLEAAKQKVLGNNEQAAVLYEQALDIDKSNHAAMHELAKLRYKQEQYAESLMWAEKSVKENTVYNRWYYGQLAQFYNLAGRYEDAARTFEIMIGQEPDHQTNYIEAANQYINTSLLDKAMHILDQMDARFGITEESAGRKQYILMRQHKYEEAVKVVIQLSETYPEVSAYNLHVAEALITVNKTDQAIEVLESIIKSDSNLGLAYFMLFELYNKKREDQKAYENLEQAFYKDDVNVQQKMQAIGSYFLDINNKTSLDRLQNLSNILVEVYPDSEIPFMIKGDISKSIDSISLAREYYLKSLEINASDFRIWNRLIDLHSRLNQPGLHLEDVEKAIVYFPNNPDLYLSKAYAYYDLENYENAVKTAREGLKIAIEKKDQVKLLVCEASSLDKMGRYLDSDTSFKDALSRDPLNAMIMNNYAYALALRGHNLQYADSLMNIAFKEQPNNPYFIDTRAWIQFKMGHYSEAVELLKKAIAIDQSRPEYFEHLAEVYAATGEPDKAKEYFNKAMDLGGENPEIIEKIKKLN